MSSLREEFSLAVEVRHMQSMRGSVCALLTGLTIAECMSSVFKNLRIASSKSWRDIQLIASKKTGIAILQIARTSIPPIAWVRLEAIFTKPLGKNSALISALWDPEQRTKSCHVGFLTWGNRKIIMPCFFNSLNWW